MTNDELMSAVNDALASLGQWKIGEAAIGAFQGNGLAAEPGPSRKPIVWLSVLNPANEKLELIFGLQSDDPQWLRQEIVRRLSSDKISIRNRLNIRGSVSGMVIGTNTGVINKNFFGGDTYHQVQFYVLSDSGRAAGTAGLIKEILAPYKFLLPYTARDLPIFQGRDNEIEHVVRIIHEQRLLVIHGEAGVGKTSLMAAGVIPRLIDEGLLVIQIQDYKNPVEALKEALAAVKEKLTIPLPENPTLPQLIGAINQAIGGTLILVLDQFELLFETSITTEQRDSFVSQLEESLNEISSEYLRMFIVIRNEVNARLWELQERLPDLLRCQFELLPLTHDEAATAIWEPLKVLKSQVTFFAEGDEKDQIPTLITKHLVPNLGALRADGNDKFIHPPHLQIVCTWLYRKATETNPPRVISERMYLDELNGADGIIASYMEETLEKLEDERRLASRIMALMATPEVETWVLPSQLHEISQDLSIETIEKVLETLVRAGLLIRRADGNYAFISPTIAREILRLAGPDVEKRNQAENELERIWLTWLARKTWATREQLRYLTTEGSHLLPRAIKTLLLLRSAVERDEPPGRWIELLSGDEGKTLIYELEQLPLPAGLKQIDLNTQKKAASLMGLSTNNIGSGSQQGLTAVGPVSLNAVQSGNPAVRQTCALALTVISDDKTVALGRLEQALDQTKGWKSRSRRAELRGTLADVDLAIEEKNSSLSRLDRTLIWKWRASRRVTRDRHRWIRLMIGGAIGAGLGIGLLRGILAFVISELGNQRLFPLIMGTMYFYYAVIVGGAFSVGFALAEPLLRKSASVNDPSADGPSRRQIRSILIPIILGATFFGVAHMVALLINGEELINNYLSILLGFAAGLGLAVAIYIQSSARRRVVGWLIGILIGTAVFTIVHFTLAGFKKYLAFSWAGPFYGSNLEYYFRKSFPQFLSTYPSWSEWFALIDSALVGLCFALGISLGLAQANKILNKRRSAADI